VTRARVVVHVHNGRKVATVRAYADGSIKITPTNDALADAIRPVARRREWVQSPEPGIGGPATLTGDPLLVALTATRRRRRPDRRNLLRLGGGRPRRSVPAACCLRPNAASAATGSQMVAKQTMPGVIRRPALLQA
jgi:hypothetical protein